MITDEQVEAVATYLSESEDTGSLATARRALEIAAEVGPQPEYEYGYKALGEPIVLTREKYARAMHERWGDKIMRREKRGEWEEVE